MDADKREPVRAFAEFAEFGDAVERLKAGDPEFAWLLAEYREIDREIRGLGQRVAKGGDDYAEGCQRLRLHLKNDLYRLLCEDRSARSADG